MRGAAETFTLMQKVIEAAEKLRASSPHPHSQDPKQRAAENRYDSARAALGEYKMANQAAFRIGAGQDDLIAVEVEREEDGRWIAEAPSVPGAVVYGATETEAYTALFILLVKINEDLQAASEKEVAPPVGPLTMTEEQERVARMDVEAPHVEILLSEIDALRAIVVLHRDVLEAAEKMAQALNQENDLCDELSEPLHTYHTAHWAHAQTRKALEKKP